VALMGKPSEQGGGPTPRPRAAWGWVPPYVCELELVDLSGWLRGIAPRDGLDFCIKKIVARCSLPEISSLSSKMGCQVSNNPFNHSQRQTSLPTVVGVVVAQMTIRRRG